MHKGYSNGKCSTISKIANEIIDRLLEKAEPFYSQYLTEEISAETKIKKDSVSWDVSIPLKKIKSWVEFVAEIAGIEEEARFDFELAAVNDLNGEITKAEGEKNNTHHQAKRAAYADSC